MPLVVSTLTNIDRQNLTFQQLDKTINQILHEANQQNGRPWWRWLIDIVIIVVGVVAQAFTAGTTAWIFALALAVIDTAINVTIDIIQKSGTLALALDFLPLAFFGLGAGIKSATIALTKALKPLGIVTKVGKNGATVVAINTKNLANQISKTTGKKLANSKVIANIKGVTPKTVLNRKLTYNQLTAILKESYGEQSKQFAKQMVQVNKSFARIFKTEKQIAKGLQALQRSSMERKDLAKIGLKPENFQQLNTIELFRTKNLYKAMGSMYKDLKRVVKTIKQTAELPVTAIRYAGKLTRRKLGLSVVQNVTTKVYKAGLGLVDKTIKVEKSVKGFGLLSRFSNKFAHYGLKTPKDYNKFFKTLDITSAYIAEQFNLVPVNSSWVLGYRITFPNSKKYVYDRFNANAINDHTTLEESKIYRQPTNQIEPNNRYFMNALDESANGATLEIFFRPEATRHMGVRRTNKGKLAVAEPFGKRPIKMKITADLLKRLEDLMDAGGSIGQFVSQVIIPLWRTQPPQYNTSYLASLNLESKTIKRDKFGNIISRGLPNSATKLDPSGKPIGGNTPPTMNFLSTLLNIPMIAMAGFNFNKAFYWVNQALYWKTFAQFIVARKDQLVSGKYWKQVFNYKKLLRVTVREANKTIFGTKRSTGVLVSKIINVTIGQAIQGKPVNSKGISRIFYNATFNRNQFTRRGKRRINQIRRVAKINKLGKWTSSVGSN